MKKILLFILFYLLTSSFNLIEEGEIKSGNESLCIFMTKRCELVMSNTLRIDFLNSDPNNPKVSGSLKLFWCDFQSKLKNDDKEEIMSVLEYPIHAIFPVIFKFACDCDTLAFVRGQEKYEDFEIDKKNFYEYYDFIFNDTLKMIILNTSFEDLVTNGIWYSDKFEGVTYNIFPKNYNLNVKCPNDHLIKLYINNKNNCWRIGFGGL